MRTTTRTFRLIVADADGENPRVIAESPQPLMSPSWSPDSRRIAYVSFEGDQSAVYVQTLRTGTRDRVSARAGVNSSPVFSPDGRMLALTLSRDQGNLDVYTLDLTTQVLRQLTNDAGIDTEAVWSPDSRTIYFTSDRSGSPQIYRVAAEPGGRAERVTFEGSYSARPRVSPDGKQLAVVYLDRDSVQNRGRRSRLAALRRCYRTAGSTSRRASRRTARKSSTRRARTAAACWQR